MTPPNTDQACSSEEQAGMVDAWIVNFRILLAPEGRIDKAQTIHDQQGIAEQLQTTRKSHSNKYPHR